MSEDSGTNILNRKALDSFISIHVHKAGGTTLGFILEELFGEDFFWDKSEDTVNFHGRPRIYDINLVRHYKIIHGHVHYSKYRILGRPVITWLRHPVSRLESEFSVIRQKRITQRSSDFHKKVILEKLEFLDYCQIHREVFARYFGNLFIEDFAFIGITELYKESLHVLSKILKKKIPPYYKRNTRRIQRQFFKEATEQEREVCREYNQRDIQFYANARNRLEKEFSQCESDFNPDDYEPLQKVKGKRYYR